MKNLITVAEYPQSQIPERYIRIRDLKRACIICRHWTSRQNLRKEKRYIVELEHGKCRTKRVPKLQQFPQDPGTPRQKHDHKRKTLRKNVHQNIPA